jgi:hypothetical protein
MVLETRCHPNTSSTLCRSGGKSIVYTFQVIHLAQKCVRRVQLQGGRKVPSSDSRTPNMASWEIAYGGVSMGKSWYKYGGCSFAMVDYQRV